MSGGPIDSTSTGGGLPSSVQKCLDDEGLLYLWSKIAGKLQLKVDKLDGFGLSSNDFTAAEKAKLQAYPAYSQLNSDITNRLSTLQNAMDTKMTNVYKFKGSVASYANLPSSNLTAGDVYNVQDTEMNYAWTGTGWDQLGSSQINIQTITNAEIDTIIGNASSGGSGSTGGGVPGTSTSTSNVAYQFYTGTGVKQVILDNPFGADLARIDIRNVTLPASGAAYDQIELHLTTHVGSWTEASAVNEDDGIEPLVSSAYFGSGVGFATSVDASGNVTRSYFPFNVTTTSPAYSPIEINITHYVKGDTPAIMLSQDVYYRYDSYATVNKYQANFLARFEGAVATKGRDQRTATHGSGWGNF